ncbi:MAG: pseudouridine synthase [Euryarchaeota archaeon]|nr:pseudouridine synthase [Euryarchaeota archaeon]
MLTKRFGFAKATTGEFETPILLDCDALRESGEILGRRVERGVHYPPSIYQREIKIDENFYLVPNANDLLRNARDFVDYTVKIRKKYGFGAIFYLPGAPAHLYPVLFYMGYDVFDDCHSRLAGAAPWGSSTNDYGKQIFDMTVDAFNEGMLREFVEGMPDNKSQELLRYLDLHYWKEQEQFYPAHKERLNAVSMNSLFRPDIQRWFERLKERYKKPDYAKHLLLIPCSARKPYSESKSHRLMARYIKSTMHEVILTSPLGLVPRELESFYPAKNYDIPVIGHWYEEEKKLIHDMLSWYLATFEYDSVVAYLPESMRFLRELLEKYDAVMLWGHDLDSLSTETRKLGYRVKRSEVLRQNMQSLSRFQFAHEFDFENVRVVGRYPRVDLKMDGERLFGYDLHRGMLTLAERSARELAEAEKYTVEIDDFWPEGDVFAAGILEATAEIRESDEVAVVHDGELRGWGIAKMSAYDMVNESRGKSVKIRSYPHKRA